MRALNPPEVYVTQRAAADPRCVARMERMLTRISGPPVQQIDDTQLAELVRERGWAGSRRASASEREGDPPVIFSRFRWDAMDEEGNPTVELPGPGPGLLYGFHPWTKRRHAQIPERDDPGGLMIYELHSVRGCLFRCQYCRVEDVLNVMLDIEEFAEHLTALMARTSQTLWKYDDGCDVLTLEPEYGASAFLTEFFGRQDRARLLYYTKSDNVGPLIGLKHNGQSIVCWTLSCHTVSRVVERDTATMEERVEAARRCQKDGYCVRFRFSPVFPLHNWRDEYRACVDLLFRRVKPDVITLLTLSRLPDYEVIAKLFDRRLLDPEYLRAADEAQNERGALVHGPLPHWVREEIYDFMVAEIKRVSPETPVAISLEAPDTWDCLSDGLAPAPDDEPTAADRRPLPGTRSDPGPASPGGE